MDIFEAKELGITAKELEQMMDKDLPDFNRILSGIESELSQRGYEVAVKEAFYELSIADPNFFASAFEVGEQFVPLMAAWVQKAQEISSRRLN